MVKMLTKRTVKNFFVWLLLICAFLRMPGKSTANAADTLSRELENYFIAAGLSDVVIEENDICMFQSSNNNTYCFVSIRSAQGNSLYVFQYHSKKSEWELQFKTTAALPQGNGKFQLVSSYASATVFERGKVSVNNIPLGDVVSIGWMREGNEEYWDRIIECVLRKDGNWYVYHVASAGKYENAYIYNDQVIYCNDEDAPQAVVNGVIQNRLRFFSLSAFPTDVISAKTKLTFPVKIPQDSDLQADLIQFAGGKKYSVYSGPGKDYMRGANGRAIVSTNDWIQVFGEENGWILIQYDITSDHMRFGYISANSLPANTYVKELSFNETACDAVTVKLVSVTDDPLFSRTTLLTLNKGTQLRRLAVMGNWSYVEFTGKEKIRGFVLSEDIEVIDDEYNQ